MKGLKFNGLRIIALLVTHLLWLQASHAENAAAPAPNGEISKQFDIYNSRGEDVPKGYVTGRSLLSYTYILPPAFNESLANLGSKDKWLDVGAGEGRAILDYCTSKYDALKPEQNGAKGKAVAMSIEDRRTPYWHQTAASLESDQIKYVFGKSLREYSLDELGKFKVITDVMGGFSYARDLSLFMEKTLGFLEVNGSFYTVLQDVHSEQGTNRPYYPDAPFLTQIANADGSEVKMCSWLKSISCVEVTCELKADWQPPIEVYGIRKVCSDVSVPGLIPVHFTAGTPPERGFQLKKASSAPRNVEATR